MVFFNGLYGFIKTLAIMIFKSFRQAIKPKKMKRRYGKIE